MHRVKHQTQRRTWKLCSVIKCGVSNNHILICLINRYYNYLYTTWLPRSLLHLVDRLTNCEDILFNFLIAHVVRHPPIRLAQRRSTVSASSSEPEAHVVQRLSERHFCLNQFAEEFGDMTLVRSSSRLDPVLYKDAVSIVRKKYRHMESVL
jgi:glucuronyl/N-acetylglucosaminyl transferase EXT1